MIPEKFIPHIEAVTEGYRQGTFTPRELFAYLLDKADGFEDRNIWITRLSMESLEPDLARLDASSPEELPLYGVPFAVKDNIDIAGVETTAACPGFAYVAQDTAFLVRQLLDAGAIPVGKTNMDQFEQRCKQPCRLFLSTKRRKKAKYSMAVFFCTSPFFCA